jgi:hypothetical protein
MPAHVRECEVCRKCYPCTDPIEDPGPCPYCRCPPAGILPIRDEIRAATTSATPDGRTRCVWTQDYARTAVFYVGRKNPQIPGDPGTFGNPFSHKMGAGAIRVGNPRAAVRRFATWLDGTTDADLEPDRRAKIIRRLPELRGHRLACWRHPGPCHAQILARLADSSAGDIIPW